MQADSEGGLLPPLQVLSRWNMFKQKLTVSRVQCVMQVLADGTAVAESRGKGPTLWCAESDPSRATLVTLPTRPTCSPHPLLCNTRSHWR